ncbi:MFS transporter [Devosia oryziradicis]|uniref:MFS transporter n=1 Tax=Devosia oryziradicis TaxID=2801335 RepID=A0ABX7BYJ8_9HYPH|nr:MFS transporter [Devosia oryziradicis]QQR36876.1 MFS transporter [Devosia oryziradicis]
MSQPARLPFGQSQRTALLLAASSAIAGSVGPIAIGSGGLAGASVLPADALSLSTMPVTTFVIGSAIAAIPAALLMRRVGRRAGFITGALVGASGAGLASLALGLGSFWLFAMGMMVLGGAAAFLQQYRFAAADASEPAFKDQAIAWVMAGGIVSGIAGPQLAIHGRSIWPDAPYAGPFFLLALLFLCAVPLLARLRVPMPKQLATGQNGRPLSRIISQPRYLLAMLITVSAYAMMSLIMTATPLAMVKLCGHSVSDAQIGIIFHVLAMFGPSFFTGRLIARFGRSTIAAAGFLLIAAAAGVALTGTSVAQFWLLLTLLGVGWNFGFIAGTAMITDLYRPEEAAKTQAFSEFALFSIIALVTFASGGLIAAVGWWVLNLLVFPLVVLGIALIVVEELADRRRAAV